jgi:opacity protein-like surface antigen
MKPFLAAAALAAALAAGSAAQAFPLPSQPAIEQGDVLRVSGGCGPGWHRGPYGGCRPNGAFYGYGYYGRYAAYPYPSRCWWTVTPYGSRRVCAW